MLSQSNKVETENVFEDDIDFIKKNGPESRCSDCPKDANFCLMCSCTWC